MMRKLFVVGAVLAALVAVPETGNAHERKITGAAIGGGIGAVIAGPVGAVVGGAAGAFVGGPRISRPRYNCWRDRRGRRHCRRVW